MNEPWISVDDSLPELTEVLRVGHLDDSGKYIVDHTFPRSRDVIVAEKKGNDYEESEGYLTRTGWASDCDYVSHWRYHKEKENGCRNSN